MEVWSQDGITVNAIGPGLFPTELTSAVLPDKDCTAQKMTKCWIGCWFFWFYDSRYVTGLGLMADGGGGQYFKCGLYTKSLCLESLFIFLMFTYACE